MLLLVIDTQFDQRRGLLPHIIAGGLDEAQHRRGDMIAIGGDRIDGRARQQTARRAWVTRPDGFVIRVEEISESGVKDVIARGRGHEQECLEKPAGVRQMPFCRADIRHRLDSLVFRREIGGEGLRLVADRGEPVALSGAIGDARRYRGGNIEHLGILIGANFG